MRGQDPQQGGLFSYLSPETRVPAAHPLRPIRESVDRALAALSPKLTNLYAHNGQRYADRGLGGPKEFPQEGR